MEYLIFNTDDVMTTEPVHIGVTVLPDPGIQGIISGNAHIAGITSLKGVPISAMVVLHEEVTGGVVSSTTSSSTGEYRFDNLDVNSKYFIIVKEPSGLWEYRVQSRITPVL